MFEFSRIFSTLTLQARGDICYISTRVVPRIFRLLALAKGRFLFKKER
jgi:hypothetical protein